MDEDDIWKKLAAIELATSKQTIFYVYYNSAGKIIHVRNEPTDDKDYPYIEVTEEEARNLDPRHNIDFDSLYVVQDKNGAFTVARKVHKIDDFLKISSHIHRVPTQIKTSDTKIKDFELCIEQDVAESKFIIHMSQYIRNNHREERFKNKTFELYVTAVNDPHVLYEILSVNIYELALNGVYIIELSKEKLLNNVNIYTNPIFGSYIHLLR